MYIDTVNITDEDIQNITRKLEKTLTEQIVGYEMMGYNVSDSSDFDISSNISKLYFDYIKEDKRYYENVEISYDYYDMSILSSNLENFFEINDKTQEIIYSQLLEIKVDIGMSFNLYFCYAIYNNLVDNIDDIHCILLAIKLYANEINSSHIDGKEVYLKIEYEPDNYLINTNGLSVMVVSDYFELLDNTLFVDINFRKNNYKLCFCCTQKEYLV